MFGNCADCKSKVEFDHLSKHIDEDQLGEQVKWYEWVQTEDGKFEKVQKCGIVCDALQSLCEKLPAFKYIVSSKQNRLQNSRDCMCHSAKSIML